MRLRRLVPIVPFALAGHLACGPAPEGPTSAASRLEGPNGLGENGLTSNGLFQNGLFPNGLFPNGLFPNGLFPNGLFPNGIVPDALWLNDLWQQNPPALEMLRTNVYAREFLEYMYECAMPAGQSMTLDPGPGGANLELKGFIGLAPEWGQSEGACGESCQRWVTACLLARTNAYGVKVDISMRAPDDAPPHVKAALAVTEAEREAYPLREGAFYGNLFRRETRDGLEVLAPKFHACAGKGSNIPQVTKRFCSSQGAGGPIDVVGTCEARPQFPQGACDPQPGGDPETTVMQRCYSSLDPDSPRTEYKEVITVYLKRPIEVCGNSVCEAGEATEGTCLSDCHPGGWGRAFAAPLARDPLQSIIYTHLVDHWATISTVDHNDDIVLAGLAKPPIDLGGGPLDLGSEWELYGALAKYGPDGQHLWSKQFGTFGAASAPGAIAAGPGGSIAVALNELALGVYPYSSYGRLRLFKFSPAGDLEWSASSADHDAQNTIAQKIYGLAFDPLGNLLVLGSFAGGALEFGGIVLQADPASDDTWTNFVLKLSPQGEPVWATVATTGAFSQPKAFNVDSDGNVLVGLGFQKLPALDPHATPLGLCKLSASSGAIMWSRRGEHLGVAAGPNGNVYATGTLTKPPLADPIAEAYDFPLPAGARYGDFFVVEYGGADGAPAHARVVTPPCRSASPPCFGIFGGRDIMLDGGGNVIVGVGGGNGDTIDFGAGSFRTYGTEDVFVAAFTPDLEPRWSKHVPMALDGSLNGMQLDGRGRVVMSGSFSGSMLVDDRLLVSHVPEQPGVENTFLAAFAVPSALDFVPPEVDGPRVPKPMTLEATGATGAEVFFTPPTSTDGGNAGASVDCSPPPNTPFAIGTTTVTCTATDPLGNATSASFDVTVVDHLGPSFVQVPSLAPVERASLVDAPVAFEVPRAVDLVDGERPVTCEPASGSVFPLGRTTVTCGASDTRGNASTASFPVVVRYQRDRR